jgi:hypothetical protein
MANASTFKLNIEVSQNLEKLLSAAEGGTARNGFVRNGDSGLSVGRLQLDLSKKPDFADKLFDAAKQAKLPELAGITADDLKQRHDAVDDAKKVKIERLVNAALKTDAGQNALRKDEAVHLDTVQRAVERVCGKAGPNAEAFCKSPEGQRELAAYVHQYGAKDTGKLEAFLAGKEVTLGADKDGAGGKPVQIDGPLTVEGFRSGYRNATRWAVENPDAAKGRDGRVDDFNRRNPVAPAPQEGADAGKPAPDAAAPVNLLTQAMSTPEMAEPERMEAETPRAKTPALSGPVGAVLGRDDGAAPSTRTVKLLQTTINEVNRPAAFDWNWSKKGRVDVDGELGPQTMAGLSRAVEHLGSDEAFAHRFARAGFRDYARRLDPDAATGLQDMLNVTRDELPDHVRFKPLLRDGRIGPVTTDAFRAALIGLGPDHLAENLAAAFRAEAV